MPYILPSAFLDKFSAFPNEYQRITGSNLSSQSSSYLPCFFGGKDTTTRKNQLDFLAKIYSELKTFIPDKNDNDTRDNQWQTYVISLRIMLAACLHVKSQISKQYAVKNINSVLITLIDEALELTSSNPVDNSTKKLCLQSAEKWLNLGDKSSNDPLFSHSFQYLEDKEITGFKVFVKEELQTLKNTETQADYPIANAMQPVFGAILAFAGSQAGYLLGGALVGERGTTAASFVITAISSNSYLSTIPGAHVGAIVLIPPMIARILSSFYGVSFSCAVGKGLGLVGEGLGFSLGMSLDLSKKLIENTYYTFGSILYQQEKTSLPSGLQLIDGRKIQSGVDIKAIESITFETENTTPAPRLEENNVKIEVIEDGEEPWLLTSTSSPRSSI